MADVRIFTGRIDAEGADRLLQVLRNDFASGRDLGPRGAQIQASGHALERASEELRRLMMRIAVESPGEDPDPIATRADVRRWRDELMQLAEAFARLGTAARAYST